MPYGPLAQVHACVRNCLWTEASGARFTVTTSKMASPVLEGPPPRLMPRSTWCGLPHIAKKARRRNHDSKNQEAETRGPRPRYTGASPTVRRRRCVARRPHARGCLAGLPAWRLAPVGRRAALGGSAPNRPRCRGVRPRGPVPRPCRRGSTAAGDRGRAGVGGRAIGGGRQRCQGRRHGR